MVVPCSLNALIRADALVLEIGIADRQRLVDDQHVGTHRGGDAERQPDLHAARVDAQRLVEVVADLGEGLDRRHRIAHVAWPTGRAAVPTSTRSAGR